MVHLITVYYILEVSIVTGQDHPYFALAVAIYGAALSTFTAVKGRRKLGIAYCQGFFCFKNKTMTTFGGVEMINKSSVPIYVKQYGFELNGKDIHIKKIDGSFFKESQCVGMNFDTNELVPLNSIEENYVDDIKEIKPGMSAVSYFYAKDLKKIYLSTPDAVINVYCVEQTGKKFRSRVPVELVLSSQEPVD